MKMHKLGSVKSNRSDLKGADRSNRSFKKDLSVDFADFKYLVAEASQSMRKMQSTKHLVSG